MTPAVPDQSSAPDVSVWRMSVAGICGVLVGVGLARFAYTPLIPALIHAGWFSAGDAAYLGAANLSGYLVGVLCAAWLGRRFGAAPVLRTMMLATSISLAACAAPLGFGWMFGWRLVSGIGGGALMILAAPAILPHIPAARRGMAGGLIFMGVGLGVAASGTLVPLLLRQGISQAWIGLGVLALALTALAWNGWPKAGPKGAAAEGALQDSVVTGAPRTGLRRVYLQYALNALGLVPHMIFLVDFVARGLGQGLDVAAFYWVMFGLGAVVGPLAGGYLADRIGFTWALRTSWVLQAGAAVLILMDTGVVSLIVSSTIMGAFTPGTVALVLGRVNELTASHPGQQKRAWSVATTGFAAFQALGAYGMSYLLASGHSYRLLFAIAAGALVLALAAELTGRPFGRRARPVTQAAEAGGGE